MLAWDSSVAFRFFSLLSFANGEGGEREEEEEGEMGRVYQERKSRCPDRVTRLLCLGGGRGV